MCARLFLPGTCPAGRDPKDEDDMGLRFIFMLTRNDATVARADDYLETALRLGLRHIGFKDVGLPLGQLKALNRKIQDAGARSYLEVVSLDRESEIASAKAAVDLGVDVLLGGTRVDDVLPLLSGTNIDYCPFPGRITGHPSVLEGSIEEITESARALAAHHGVAGLDLLAYRSHDDVPALMASVCAAVDKPVYMAGSIEGPEQIAAVKAAGGAGFTIGTAALDGHYPAMNAELGAQLGAILRDVAQLNGHLSPHHKNGLRDGDPLAAKLSASDVKVQLKNLVDQARWRFHDRGDELFFVHQGRLLMKFRDREEIVEPGEYILVPRGVERRPVGLGGGCDVVHLSADGRL
ncbi:MAG: cupin domain-containing protein [Pseudomonadota bacterium]